MVGKEPEHEEKVQIIKDLIKEHGEDGKSMGYKQLQNLCAELFEGVRLVLKRMKSEVHLLTAISIFSMHILIFRLLPWVQLQG